MFQKIKEFFKKKQPKKKKKEVKQKSRYRVFVNGEDITPSCLYYTFDSSAIIKKDGDILLPEEYVMKK